ncbi:MAG: Ig-like domain-containing protein, partial [Elusimicrobiota bacterium]
MRSSEEAGNLSAISNTALWDLTPPQVAAIDILDGAVVSRPRRVTAAVTDDIAVSAVVFSVDDIVQSTVTFPPYAFDWDTRKLVDGIHSLTVQATDASGNTVQTGRSITVSYLPPAVPTIGSPASGFTTNVSTISVSGLAEAGTTAQLLINGNLAASIFVADAPLTDGAFIFRDVPLAAQGANLISVRALDSRAASPNSPSIQVILLLGAPQIPSDLSAESVAGGAITLSWVTVSTDTRTASYALYRSTDAALLPPGAAAPPASRVATNIAGSRYTDVPQADGVYYYALTAIDLAGNQSGLSSLASAVSDRTAPTAAFRLTSAAAPVGPGTYAAELSLSKVLAQPPLLTLAPFGSSPSPLPLTAVTATLWRTTVTIAANTPSGVAVFGFNGTDLVGNAGKTITQGGTLVVDAQGPIGTVSLSKSSPVGPGPLGITLTLDESAASPPSLSIALLSGSIFPVSLVESSTNSRIWSGQVATTTATGDGSATLLYSAADPLGNASSLLTGGVTRLDIKTAPPGLPIALRATSLSGARVSLSWSAPVGDALAAFRVYRDGAFLMAVSPAADRSGSLIDTPAEGSYQYTVSAVDLAGNEGPTIAVIGRARATPPAPPVDLASSINSAGQILLTWQAGSTDTVRFRVYRATAVIVGLAGVAPRDSVSPLTDLPTQDANYHYVVTALDDAGNESTPSSETVITFDRAGPTVDVSGVANAGLYNRTVFPSFTASSLILDAASVRATLDSQTFLSGSPVSVEGSHTLVVTAANTRGRVSTATVTFAIDKTPPAIVLSGILEGELLRSSGAISITVTDANMGTPSFSLYNQVLGTTVTYRSGDLIVRNGRYVLFGLATDLAGNSSTATLTFQLAAGPLAPGNLSVLIQDGARLSWEQPEPGVVAYRAYRDGVRISGSFLNSMSFVDPAFTAGTAHVYEVSAVDAYGVEGPKARASIPAIDLSLSPVTLTRGFFEEVRPTIVNRSLSDAFVGPADVELIDATGLLVSAKAPVSGVSAGATGNLAATLAVPATLPAGVSMRVTAALQTDFGASVAIRKSIAVSVVDPPLPLV